MGRLFKAIDTSADIQYNLTVDMQKRDIIALVFVVIAAVAGYFIFTNRDIVFKGAFAPPPSNLKEGVTSDKVGSNSPDVEVIAEGLEIPWEIAFLPDGDFLVTERPGRLLRIDGETREVIPIEGVAAVGEGGLLGLALHPEYEDNQRIYLYSTTGTGGNLSNRVEAYHLEETALDDKVVVIDNIPGSKYHDGGRIKFGPDLHLYITTGDAQQEDQAQELGTLNGKILRIAADGSIPEDNPFEGNPIYSYGHRNPQGITWAENGLLWSTEHGRSGKQTGLDELNLIFKSNNYGWPEIDGDRTKAGMQNPVIHSGPDEAWAPASAEYYDGSVFFGGLRGQALYEAKLSEDRQEFRELVMHFREDFGRIRTVRLGPDGNFYILTSNEDGRGKSSPEGDKIIRVNPEIFR